AKVLSPFFKPKFMYSLRLNIYRMIGSDDYVATPNLKLTYLKIIKEDLSKDMEKIKLKTLLIWGDKDKDTPKKDAFIMNTKIKNSVLKTIKDAGHMLIITDPEIVSEYIINFINDDF
ncbi:MAG: alpha/beta hydrolase, partial [Patescibacteria group bacterium]